VSPRALEADMINAQQLVEEIRHELMRAVHHQAQPMARLHGQGQPREEAVAREAMLRR
jgi:hypothetical protein